MPPKSSSKVEPKLLGEGSYGCVFQPAIPCAEKRSPLNTKSPKKSTARAVGKVFESARRFQQELKATERAVKIDPTGETMLVPSAICKTTRARVEAHPKSEDCDIIVDSSAKGSKTMYELLMPYGGTRFDRYFRNQTKPVSLADFVEMITPLFKGLQLMEEHQMCHQDLKSGNLLITPQGKAIIIDFSLMVPFSKVFSKDNTSRHRFTYNPYPAEYKLVAYAGVDERNIPNEAWRNVFQFGSHLGHRYESFYSAQEFYERVQQLETTWRLSKKPVQEFLRPYANRVDVYGMAMAICDVLDYIKVPKKKEKAFNTFMRAILDPNTIERASPKEAMELLEKIKG